MRVAILTISDRSFRREREDRSGPSVAVAVSGLFPGAALVERTLLPDEREPIEAALRRICDDDLADLVLTTGGTGLSPRDVTPEATWAIGAFEVPGLSETMRSATRAGAPTAILSRQVAVVRRRTLIVNLPGSPSGAVECLGAIAGVLPHAIRSLRGAGDGDHSRGV